MPRIINSDDCTSCGACEAECPTAAISAGDTSSVIDTGKCNDCPDRDDLSRCEEACPADCIHRV